MIEISFLYVFYFYYLLRNEAIMDKKNKKQIIESILKLNLIIGIYNIFLYCNGGSIINLIIGSMNIGVWTFFRDGVLLFLIRNKISKRN